MTTDAAHQVPDRMNTQQAAAHLGLAQSTVEKMRHEGRGPRFLKIGGKVVYRRRDLDSYLDACAIETQDTRGKQAA